MRPLENPPFLAALAASLILTACSSIQPQAPSAGHIRAEAQPAPSPDIPPPVATTVMLQRPRPAAKIETYSVSVRNIPVQDLLFALARDAKINIDIDPDIRGIVTINAIDQTLQQILTRISKQLDMRWEFDGTNLVVTPDAPFLRSYKVDYVNMSRSVEGKVSINTQIASTSTSATGSTSGGGGNNSSTSVDSKSGNDFWKSLKDSLEGILNDTDKTKWERRCEEENAVTANANASSSGDRQTSTIVPAVGPTTATSGPGQSSSQKDAARKAGASTTCGQVVYKTEVIVNADAGIVVVRATSLKHEKIQAYLDLVMASARRQVVIEATIAEVTLSDGYQQGINWQSLRSLRPGAPLAGFSAAQNPTTATNPVAITSGSFATPTTAPTFGASAGQFAFLLNFVAPGLGLSSTLTLLETFGKVKVLSSPKISVLNNQTAMLKVVNNLVYFEVKNDSTTTTTGTTNNFTATAKSVSVGLVMSVTPQISENGSILLNVRPTISSKTGDVQDPTPNLGATNNVPVIQTREMESMLRLTDGEIAVMGGLMEDKFSNNTNQIPGLGDLPGIGNFFRNRSDTSTKTELVIFLKPTIIRDPSINGDYHSFRDQLPRQDFFANNPGPAQKEIVIPGANAK